MRNCEECIYQIKGSCSKFECEETTIEQFEQKVRNKVIDEMINHVEFEEKWLSDAWKDNGYNYSSRDVDIAFSGIKHKLRQMKGEK